MPSYSTGTLIKLVRERKKMSQDLLLAKDSLRDEGYDVTNISRIENIRQNPRPENILKLMESLELAIPTFFCPHLTEQTVDIFSKRDRILSLLHVSSNKAVEEAEVLVHELEQIRGFDSFVNYQFILRCKAQLNEIRVFSASETLALVQEGIQITYKEFDEFNFEGDLLIFEEAALLHMMALAYSRLGERNRAIALLRRILEGISRLSEDSPEKESNFAIISLSLAEFLVQEKLYDEALEVCLTGDDVSIKRNNGAHTPDFLFSRAICSHYLGDADSCRKNLQLAYFGYYLLRKQNEADKVRKFASEVVQYDIITYDVDNLRLEEIDISIKHGGLSACASIGELIRNLRKKAKLTQVRLCAGICKQPALAKMEKDKIPPNIYFLEAIMQRLGRDINKYFCLFPSVDDFADKLVRDEITKCVANLKFEEASALLEKLKFGKGYKKKGLGKQFILEAEATILASKEGYDNLEYMSMLKNALTITKPQFDEREVDRYRLTYTEITIINQMAIHYCEAREISRGIKLFERLRDSINYFYIDEHEKVRSYVTVLYNYSKYLGIAKRFDDALEIVTEGEELAVKHKQMILLPSFAVNRAWCLYQLGKKEKSVPYFAMAYFGALIIGEKDSAPTVAEFVREHLEMELIYLGLGG